MTPDEYFDHTRRLSRARDMVGIMAFAKEHLTDKLLDEMTPHQRRLAHSTIHVAAPFVGEGPLDPPTGIPVDDDEDDLADAATGDSTVPARAR
jgi:hypothetical protein